MNMYFQFKISFKNIELSIYVDTVNKKLKTKLILSKIILNFCQIINFEITERKFEPEYKLH